MNKLSFFINIAFLTVLADALINYFLKTFYHRLPVLAVVPLFFIIYLMANTRLLYKFGISNVAFIALGFVGYFIGVITIDDVPSNRILEMLSAFVAWGVGYLWVIQEEKGDVDRWRIVLFLTVIHAAVCIVALIKVAPSYFPIYDYLWSLKGLLISRPSVTTDQNFQIFYFLPIIGILVFYKNWIQVLIAFFGLVMSAYVISALQTRSGVLILAGALFLGLMLHMFCKNGQRIRAIFLTVLLSVFVVIVVVYKYEEIQLLVIRFTQESYKTGFGRLHGLVYFFEKIWNPVWWLPQGNADYMKVSHGQIPHSNITAHFLEGGILGVFAWIGLIVWPTIKLSFALLRKGLDRDSAIICVISVGAFVTQMSLNVPFMDITWLYGGIAAGALYKLNKKKLEKQNDL